MNFEEEEEEEEEEIMAAASGEDGSKNRESMEEIAEGEGATEELKLSSAIVGGDGGDNISEWVIIFVGSCNPSSTTAEEEPGKQSTPPRSVERGWLETSLRMGVKEPKYYCTRVATRTDVDPNQHRLQLNSKEFGNSMLYLRSLAMGSRPQGIGVKVTDRMGHVYDMTFKHLKSSDTFRFMGAGYSSFLQRTGLRVRQVVEIYGLPGIGVGDEGHRWLALVNRDASEAEEIEMFN